jgi:hypothetical protein
VSRFVPTFAVDAVVEERIQEAARRGDFDNLPGSGRPLDLDEAPLVPPELRAAYRMLKNAGFVPPEILERREIAALEASIATLTEVAARKRARAKLAVLRTRLGARRGRNLALNAYYERKVIEKLAG